MIDQRGGFTNTTLSLPLGIYGDIRLTNGHADTINWNGGVIVGNIHGDDTDDLNVFAGEGSQFSFDGDINVEAITTAHGVTYVGDIRRFGTIAVNTTSHSATGVSFAVGGHIKATALDVNNSGTLEVKPTANIDVSHMYVAGTGATVASGTVQWGLKPSVPQHGIITAGDVTIGEGARSVAHALPGLFKAHEDFLVIASTDISGEFNFSEDFTSLYTVTDSYEDDGYHIILDRMAFRDIPGLNGNGAAAGAGIDKILDELNQSDPEGPLATLLGQILVGSPEDYARGMNELAGSQNGDLLQAALEDPGKLLDIIFGQLGGGGLGAGFADLGALIQVADNNVSAIASDAPASYVSLVNPSPVARPLSVWARVFGNWSSLDRNPGSGASGFTSNGGGVVVGANYQLTDNFLAGLAGGYQRNRIDFRGTGNADVNSYSLSAYGRYEQGKVYIDGLVGASYQSYDMTRLYTPILTTYTARRSPSGASVMAGLEAGYDYDFQGGSRVEPFAGFAFSRIRIDGSTETGSGPGNLTIDDQTGNSANSRLGVRWSSTFGKNTGSELTPMLQLGWKHEFADRNPSTTASLAGLPGSSFTVQGAEAPKDTALVGVGLQVKFSDRLDGSVRYDGDFGSGYTNSTASLRLRLQF